MKLLLALLCALLGLGAILTALVVIYWPSALIVGGCLLLAVGAFLVPIEFPTSQTEDER